jgi:DNA-binding NarL/FixJ family response regulator
VPVIGVLVVDDHPLARSGISALLGSENGIMVVAEAKSGEEGLECFRTSRPDIAVIDVNLPGIDGWETTQKLTDEFPAALVILTSMFGDASYWRRAEEVGARGFLVKTQLRGVLVSSIRAICSGGTVFL